MISAVQEQERQRQRTRSAASGPAFSVPLMPPLGVTPTVSPPLPPSCVETAPVAAPVAAPGAAPVAAPAATQVAAPAAPAAPLSSYIGRYVGSGQCVALVKAVIPSLGPASGWAGGAGVQGNTTLLPGTPIATFSDTGRYASTTDGSSHAAIYLGQDQHGVMVLDQWAGSTAAVRTIPWSNPGAAAANTGAAFRVVRSA